MLSSSDPVASIIPAMSLDSTSDNAMTALSRLALGPVNTDHYLAVFERFDDAGRTRTTWNWAACVFTLNWMVFRQLWGAALVYVAAAEGLALVVFGLGRSFLQWPQGVEWGVLGTVALMAFVVPGLYGDAILYADIRKRVARALAASRTVPEACVLLEKQASSRKRLQGLVLINLMLAGAAALLYLVLPLHSAKPLAMEPSVTVAQTTAAATAAAAASSANTSAAPQITTPTAAQANTVAPAATGAAPDAPAHDITPQPVVPAPRPTPAPASAPRTTQDALAKTAITPPRRDAVASRPATAVKSKTPARGTAAASAESAASAASAAAAAAPTPSAGATVGAAPGYYINVGLFADEANARKAQARLLNEGFPAFRQELNNSKGRRIRVRVGPYENRAKADEAANAIRTMALDAVVFKQ